MIEEKQLSQLLQKHHTSKNGLSEQEVQTRLEQYGPNAITGAKKTPLILIFLEGFKDLLVIILIFAAILALIAGETADAIVILIVVFLNATIGFTQTYRAEKAIEALNRLIAPKARVLRNGKEEQIDANQVVPGDILILSEGDSITADAILFEANELQTQESALTGESVPVGKEIEHSAEAEKKEESAKNLSIAATNMVFMGTIITSGTGKAIVTATGMHTEMGRIAKLTTETKKDTSPLQKEMFRIGVFVGKIALVISAVLFVVGYFFQGKELIETLLFASSVAVAAVPEGLPATITIALAIGVQRLARKNAIVKQLSSAETLGSTTVICSDKTGTLTKNEMTVKEIYCSHRETSPHPEKLMECAGLCNNATLEQKDGKWHMLGDPTEGALLTMIQEQGFTKVKLQEKFQRVRELTFDSDRKRMSVIVKDHKGTHYIFTKGAPLGIIDIATQFIDEGKITSFSSEDKKRFEQKSDEMAGRALRGLAFAYRELTPAETTTFQKTEKNEAPQAAANSQATTKPLSKEALEKNLIFLGITGMIDPPRPEVQEAVALAHKAHIRIYVITGDHGLTAQAIAMQLGIVSPKRPHKIITGIELNELSDAKLQELLHDKNLDIIFARVSPEHKLRIVVALKHLKEIVAVTGDGVNDAPALKKADIGIAMGITGTDVSKEAANMVLADDSFSSIITAINEGRTIYNNLKKFVFYMFSCNISEVLIVFAAILMGLPSPLTAILILLINIGTDVLPAVALGVDPPEPGIMEKPPRSPHEKIMNKPFVIRYLYLGIAIGIIVMAIYINTLMRYGWTWGTFLAEEDPIHLKASTVAFTLLIVIQMAQAFNARSDRHSIFKIGPFSNLWLLGAITISLILTVLMVEVPFFQHYLHTTSLTGEDWGIIIGSSLIIIILEEIRKIFVRRRYNRLNPKTA